MEKISSENYSSFETITQQLKEWQQNYTQKFYNIEQKFDEIEESVYKSNEDMKA